MRVKPPFSPEDYTKIETMAGYGLNQTQIASLYDLSLEGFKKRTRSDGKLKLALKKGRAKALLNVAKTAYDLAITGKVPAMTMFYLKCRGGWRERDRVEHTGKDGKPIESKNEVKVIIEDYTSGNPHSPNPKTNRI